MTTPTDSTTKSFQQASLDYYSQWLAPPQMASSQAVSPELGEMGGYQPGDDLARIPALLEQNQGAWEVAGREAAKSLGALMGMTVQSFGELLQATEDIGKDSFQYIHSLFSEQAEYDDEIMDAYFNPITKWGIDLQNYFEENFPVYQNPFNPSTGVSIAEGIPSIAGSVGMMLPGELVANSLGYAARMAAAGKYGLDAAKIADKTAEFTKLKSVLNTNVAERGLSGFLMTESESRMVADQTYQDVYQRALQSTNPRTKQNYTPLQAEIVARRAAMGVRNKNRILLTATNVGQSMLLARTMKGVMNKYAPLTVGAARVAEKELPKVLPSLAANKYVAKSILYRYIGVPSTEIVSEMGEEGLQYTFTRNAEHEFDVDRGLAYDTDFSHRAWNYYTKEGDFMWNVIYGGMGAVGYMGGIKAVTKLAQKTGMWDGVSETKRQTDAVNSLARRFSAVNNAIRDTEMSAPFMVEFMKKVGTMDLAINAIETGTEKPTRDFIAGMKLATDENINKNGWNKEYIDKIDDFLKVYDETIEKYDSYKNTVGELFAASAARADIMYNINREEAIKWGGIAIQEKSKIDQSFALEVMDADGKKLFDAITEMDVASRVAREYRVDYLSGLKRFKRSDRYMKWLDRKNTAAERTLNEKKKELAKVREKITGGKDGKFKLTGLMDNIATINESDYVNALVHKELALDNQQYFAEKLKFIKSYEGRKEMIKEREENLEQKKKLKNGDLENDFKREVDIIKKKSPSQALYDLNSAVDGARRKAQSYGIPTDGIDAIHKDAFSSIQASVRQRAEEVLARNSGEVKDVAAAMKDVSSMATEASNAKLPDMVEKLRNLLNVLGKKRDEQLKRGGVEGKKEAGEKEGKEERVETAPLEDNYNPEPLMAGSGFAERKKFDIISLAYANMEEKDGDEVINSKVDPAIMDPMEYVAGTELEIFVYGYVNPAANSAGRRVDEFITDGEIIKSDVMPEGTPKDQVIFGVRKMGSNLLAGTVHTFSGGYIAGGNRIVDENGVDVRVAQFILHRDKEGTLLLGHALENQERLEALRNELYDELVNKKKGVFPYYVGSKGVGHLLLNTGIINVETRERGDVMRKTSDVITEPNRTFFGVVSATEERVISNMDIVNNDVFPLTNEQGQPTLFLADGAPVLMVPSAASTVDGKVLHIPSFVNMDVLPKDIADVLARVMTVDGALDEFLRVAREKGVDTSNLKTVKDVVRMFIYEGVNSKYVNIVSVGGKVLLSLTRVGKREDGSAVWDTANAISSENAVAEALSERLINVSKGALTNKKLFDTFPIPFINSDGKIDMVTDSYYGFLAKNSKTSLAPQTLNGKVIYAVQPNITITRQFIKNEEDIARQMEMAVSSFVNIPAVEEKKKTGKELFDEEFGMFDKDGNFIEEELKSGEVEGEDALNASIANYFYNRGNQNMMSRLALMPANERLGYMVDVINSGEDEDLKTIINKLFPQLEKMGVGIGFFAGQPEIAKANYAKRNIGLNVARVPRTEHRLDYIVAHEMLHFLTLEALSDEKSDFSKSIKDLFEQAKSELAKKYDEDVLKEKHWFDNAKEFVSRFYGEPLLREELRSIKPKREGLWGKVASVYEAIVNSIKRFLGFETKDTSIGSLLNQYVNVLADKGISTKLNGKALSDPMISDDVLSKDIPSRQFFDAIDYLYVAALEKITSGISGSMKDHLRDKVEGVKGLVDKERDKAVEDNLKSVYNLNSDFLSRLLVDDNFDKAYRIVSHDLKSTPGILLEDLDGESDAEAETADSMNMSDQYGRESFERDPFQRVSADVRWFFSSIPIQKPFVNEKGEKTGDYYNARSVFGFTRYMPMDDVYKDVIANTAGLKGEQVYDKIRTMAKNRPIYRIVAAKLADLRKYINDTNRINQYNQIINFLSKQRKHFITVDEQSVKDPYSYSSVASKMRGWERGFKILGDGKLIKTDKDGNYYVDVEVGRKLQEEFRVARGEALKKFGTRGVAVASIVQLRKLGIVINPNVVDAVSENPALMGYTWATPEDFKAKQTLAFKAIISAAADIFNIVSIENKKSLVTEQEDDTVSYASNDPFTQRIRSLSLLARLDAVVNSSNEMLMFRNPEGNNYYVISQNTHAERMTEELKEPSERLKKAYPHNNLIRWMADEEYKKDFFIYFLSGMSLGRNYGKIFKDISPKEREVAKVVAFVNNNKDTRYVPVLTHGDRKTPGFIPVKHIPSARSTSQGIVTTQEAVNAIKDIYLDEQARIERVRAAVDKVKRGELSEDVLEKDYHYVIDKDGNKDYENAYGNQHILVPFGEVNDIVKFVFDETQKVYDQWIKMFTGKTLNSKLLEAYSPMPNSSTPYNDRIFALAMDYTVNYIVGNGSFIPLAYGDPAHYGDMRTLWKRLSSGTSPGDMTSYGGETINAAIVNDPQFGVMYSDGLSKDLAEVLKTAGYGEDYIKQRTSAVDEALSEAKPSDSQAIIFIGLYEKLLTTWGKMTPQMKRVIDKAKRGEPIIPEEMAEGLRAVKPLYVANVWDEELGDFRRVIVKMTFFPLYKQLADKFEHLQDIYGKMEEGLDILFFPSAVKAGITKVANVYDGQRNFNAEAITEDKYLRLPMDGLVMQIDNPYDEEDEIKTPSQLAKKLFEDLNDPQFAGIKLKIGEKTMGVVEARDLFETLYSANIEAKYNSFLSDFKIEKTDKGYRIGDFAKFRDMIAEEVERRYDLFLMDAFDIVKINEQGAWDDPENLAFAIPPFVLPHADSLLTFINSLFHNRLVKRKQFGLFNMQTSPVFFQRKDSKEWSGLSEENKELLLKKYGIGMPKFIRTERTESGKVKVLPAEIYLPYHIQRYFPEGNIPNELLKGVIARIPYQYMSSSLPVTVKFLPEEMGNMVVVPDGFYAFSGSDNDGDKLSIMLPAFDVNKKGEIYKVGYHENIDNIYKSDYDALEWKISTLAVETTSEGLATKLEEIGEYAEDLQDDKLLNALGAITEDISQKAEIASTLFEIVKNKPSLEAWKAKVGDKGVALANSRRARNNRLLEIYRGIMLRPEVLDKMLYKNSVDALRPVYDDVVKIQGYTAPSVVLSPSEQDRLYRIGMSGKYGNSIMALSSVNDSMFKWADISIPFAEGMRFLDGKGNERTLTSLSGTRDINGKLKSENLLATWSLPLDMMKHPEMMEALNVNLMTLPTIGTLLRAGLDIDTTMAFISQPILKLAVDMSFSMPERNERMRFNHALNDIYDNTVNALMNYGVEEGFQRTKFAGSPSYKSLMDIASKYRKNVPKEERIKYLKDTLEILKRMMLYGGISNDLSAIANTINLDVNPKKGFFSSKRAMKNYRDIQNDQFTYVKGASSLLKGTFLGKVFDTSLSMSWGLMTDQRMFPYATKFYDESIDYVNKQFGFLTENMNDEMVRASIAYFNSIAINPVHGNPQNFQEYIKSLSFGPNSVAKRMSQYFNTREGQENPLSENKLDIRIASNVSFPDRINFIFNITDKRQITKMVNGVASMLQSRDDDVRKLGEDFIRMLLIHNSGTRVGRGLARITPIYWLRNMGYGQFFYGDKFTDGLRNRINAINFASQFIRNNPFLLHNISEIEGNRDMLKTEGRMYVNINNADKVNDWMKMGIRRNTVVLKRRMDGDGNAVMTRTDGANGELGGVFYIYDNAGKLGMRNWAEYNANILNPMSLINVNQPFILPRGKIGAAVPMNIPERAKTEILPIVNLSIKQNFGEINFQEEQTTGYKTRTIKNASADATIALAVDFNSDGEKLTKSSVLQQNKKYIPIDANTLTVTKERVDKIVEQLNSIKPIIKETETTAKIIKLIKKYDALIKELKEIPEERKTLDPITRKYFTGTELMKQIRDVEGKKDISSWMGIEFSERRGYSKEQISKFFGKEGRNKIVSELINLVGENNAQTYTGLLIHKDFGLEDVIYQIEQDFGKQSKGITLNIAGNGIYTMRGKYTQQQVDDFTYDLLNQVINSPNLKTKIKSIRSGGQTGFDEAGAKAGIRLGLPTTILAPKNWTFRVDLERFNNQYKGKVQNYKINFNKSVDISDEQQFKKRFETLESTEQPMIKGEIVLNIIEDKVQKGEATTTLRNEGYHKQFYKGDGVYKTSGGNFVNIKHRGLVKLVDDKVVGDGFEMTRDELGKAEGFGDWEGFKKEARYAGMALRNGNAVHLYDISPVNKPVEPATPQQMELFNNANKITDKQKEDKKNECK